jgi:hypothetical protein
MSDGILSRCGYRCDLCLAYRPNVENNDRRELLSEGWYKYFGFRIPPEKIICDGCLSPGDPRLVDAGCPVRPCAIAKGVHNCGHCWEYICDKLKERLVSRAELERKRGGPIPEGDYRLFVKP